MEIKSRFDHFNINVTDLGRSLEFYDKALGLKETDRKEAGDGKLHTGLSGRRADGIPPRTDMAARPRRSL